MSYQRPMPPVASPEGLEKWSTLRARAAGEAPPDSLRRLAALFLGEPGANAARALIFGSLYRPDGVQLASVAQEALTRIRHEAWQDAS